MNEQGLPKKSLLKKVFKVVIISCGICVALMVLIIIIAVSSSRGKEANKTDTLTDEDRVVTEKTDGQNKTTIENAQKELTEFMDIAKKAGLVKSYEFSETAAVVFIDKTWYVQPVTFKKDFLAKVAMLKKSITGFKHFEIRDAYSNEKVAEVTSFTGSLEVYK